MEARCFCLSSISTQIRTTDWFVGDVDAEAADEFDQMADLLLQGAPKKKKKKKAGKS